MSKHCYHHIYFDSKLMNKLMIKLISAALAFSFSLTVIADHNTEEALQKRTAPIGTLNVASAEVETVAAEPRDGVTVYNTACMACHASGVAGAPMVGDIENWTPRIAKGLETLIANAINGFQGEGVMPARGGNPTLTDEEVGLAVEHMVSLSQ
ncbi:MAG: cytochrome c5 family protein [Gammaproteobacteria bacterium]|nr:cytochrome c5 family protein [Gammaproteobacteria bacterium]